MLVWFLLLITLISRLDIMLALFNLSFCFYSSATELASEMVLKLLLICYLICIR